MESIILFLKDWAAIIIAAISIIIAMISLVKSSKAQGLQNKVNELELTIKRNQLEKIEAEKAAAEYSCVEARVVNVHGDKYKLKIWNSGNTTVYNVVATIPQEANIRLLNEKMPFEELEPNKSFEEHLIVFLSGSANKFKITTSWEDKNGNKKEKVQMGDL